MSEDDDEDVPRQAFPITPGLQPPKGPPSTGAHYLAQVRAQAATLPSVLVASDPPLRSVTRSTFAQESALVSTPTTLPPRVPRAPRGTEPCPTWEYDLLTAFANLQALVTTEVLPESSAGLSPALTSSSSEAETFPPADWRAYFATHRPFLSRLRSLDFVSVLAALNSIDESVPSEASEALAALREPSKIGEWIFSLLAFISPPLCPDSASVARSLLIKVATARTLVDPTDEQSLAILNVLITILSHHFGQKDSPNDG